jgi:ATP-dependent RNA helicase DHX8/PRP22
VQNIFYRPKDKETQADQKKTKFNNPEGDHLTYLSVFEGWRKSGFSSSWCHENYIQMRSLKRAQDVKKQILDLLGRYKFKVQSCEGNMALIRKTIVSGYFFHAAKKDSKGGYRTSVDDHQVYIHPSSALFNKEPEWVIYHELVFTSK